jgi:predicted nuclease of restriction endonuclease-like (RecB) superfamily
MKVTDIPEIAQSRYQALLSQIGEVLKEGRRNAIYSINHTLVRTNWHTGRYIVEFEQKGNVRATYGTALLDNLSRDLTKLYGKGFSRSNLNFIRMLYVKYPNCETLSHKLSWSHYFELLKIDDDLERKFYEKQCIHEAWSVRELKRQKQTSLFHRIALSKDKDGILALSREGMVAKEETDIVKDPYILEFLKIPENYRYTEKELEQRIIDHLQTFLLELGKGFAFIGRQYRITLSNTHYFVDLVFYHRILKCFVLIDLKRGEVNHSDIGQMNMYLNYFAKEESVDDDKEPIGIILAAEKDHVMVEYALGSITNNLFISKYQLYLPDREELENKLKHLLE